MLHFDPLKIHSCGKHLRKRKIARNKQFILFSQCLLPDMALHFHFKCTLKCHLNMDKSKMLSSGNGLIYIAVTSAHIIAFLQFF